MVARWQVPEGGNGLPLWLQLTSSEDSQGCMSPQLPAGTGASPREGPAVPWHSWLFSG